MKTKKEHIIIVSFFCSFLAIMFFLYIFLPKTDFSELEKRYLNEFPEITKDTVASGEFGNNLESYMADHMPFRDFFVGTNSYFELYTGRRLTSDIYLTKDNALVEAPVEMKLDKTEKDMKAINAFAEKIDVKVDFMVVPSSGWASRDRVSKFGYSFPDYEQISTLYSLADSSINKIDVRVIFDNPSLYYKTDHHWNSLGAYTAYETYMNNINKNYRAQSEFTIEKIDGFCGSNYSRAALWLTPSDSLELWTGSKNITVTNNESKEVNSGVFYRDRLNETDKYTVYLDGNHSLVKIHNPDAKTKDTIVVVRDSYSNCLGGFLCESYENVILVDLRYYKQPVSELCKTEGADNVLICYSLHNFLTDTNITWLE